MMRFGPSSRLNGRSGIVVVPERTYALAQEYFRLVRVTARKGRAMPILGPVQPIRNWFNRWRLSSYISPRRDRCWNELAKNFQGLIMEVQRLGGVEPSPSQQAVFWAGLTGPLQTAIASDPQKECFAAVLWDTATEGLTLPPPEADRIRCKFHLRAPLDEIPSGRAQATLITWAFSGWAPGRPPTDVEDELIEKGILELAAWMLNAGTQLDNLTLGAITQAHLGDRTNAKRQIGWWLFG